MQNVTDTLHYDVTVPNSKHKIPLKKELYFFLKNSGLKPSYKDLDDLLMHLVNQGENSYWSQFFHYDANLAKRYLLKILKKYKILQK